MRHILFQIPDAPQSVICWIHPTMGSESLISIVAVSLHTAVTFEAGNSNTYLCKDKQETTFTNVTTNTIKKITFPLPLSVVRERAKKFYCISASFTYPCFPFDDDNENDDENNFPKLWRDKRRANSPQTKSKPQSTERQSLLFLVSVSLYLSFALLIFLYYFVFVPIFAH